MERQVKIGTSGYSYEDWKGPFYPQDLPDSEMLSFYSRHFDIVELNATYYTIPSSKTFERMAAKTPDGFEFIIKANQETTHRRRENAGALNKLLESVKPLGESGKLRGFLAQFPYSFKNTESNRKYLRETKRLLGRERLFVEFRNFTWLKPQIPAFLQTNEIYYVNVDEPPLKGLLPMQDVVCGDEAYVRLHGRNSQDWWEGKGSARYTYLYSEDELREWLTNISRIISKAFRSYIFFNNHPAGNAVKNATQMMRIIEDATIPGL